MEFGALILWCFLIFFFSSIPNLSSGLPQDFLLRKISHIGEFSILTFLLWLVVKEKKGGKTLTFLVVSFFAIDYAIFDEIHQLFVVGRSGNIFDVGVDGVGILVTVLVLWLLQNKNKRTALQAVL